MQTTIPQPPHSGPFETEREARDSVRHILDSLPGTGAWKDGSHRLLEDACRIAGVQLGAYDHQILVWLAGWEPQTCAVIAGLITRAHSSAAGGVTLTTEQAETVLLALRDAMDFHTGNLTDCADCDAAERAGEPTGACERHRHHFHQGSRYLELTEFLGGGLEVTE